MVLLQQIVFADAAGMGAEDSEDGQIAALLQDARPVFEALCRKPKVVSLTSP